MTLLRPLDAVLCVGSLCNLVVTALGYIPPVLSGAASLAALLWIIRQWLWARKDRKSQGK